jgi:hypothetical protein
MHVYISRSNVIVPLGVGIKADDFKLTPRNILVGGATSERQRQNRTKGQQYVDNHAFNRERAMRTKRERAMEESSWTAVSTTVDGKKIEGEYTVSGHLVKVRHQDRELGGDLGSSDPEAAARKLLRELAEEGHA